MEVGAGALDIKDIHVERDTDLVLGVGNVDLEGLFLGNMSLECDVGDVTLTLDDAEEDHNYEIECSLGNVRVGSHSYTSLANEISIDNSADSTYDIECSLGSVNLEFAK